MGLCSGPHVHGLRKIVPIRIGLFDELDFPGSAPQLQLTFAGEGFFACGESFAPDELVAIVLGGEAFELLGLVLPDAFGEIVGVADVDRAVLPACDDVGPEWTRHSHVRFPNGIQPSAPLILTKVRIQERL